MSHARRMDHLAIYTIGKKNEKEMKLPSLLLRQYKRVIRLESTCRTQLNGELAPGWQSGQ
jgi:hypothetical protein